MKKAKLAKTVNENPGYDDELGFMCREVTKNESRETMHQSKSSTKVFRSFEKFLYFVESYM